MTRINKKAKILWVDLEMTGLYADKDRILEVAAIATDWNFREIASYEGVVKVPRLLIKRRMLSGKDATFWRSIPETRDALIGQNATGRSSRQIEQQLISFLDNNFDTTKPVLLAGNSIHQDRKFIDRQWPELAKKLHYRMLDVSAWKVVMEGKYKKKFSKTENHRALDDIRGSIEELEYYLNKAKF